MVSQLIVCVSFFVDFELLTVRLSPPPLGRILKRIHKYMHYKRGSGMRKNFTNREEVPPGGSVNGSWGTFVHKQTKTGSMDRSRLS